MKSHSQKRRNLKTTRSTNHEYKVSSQPRSKDCSICSVLGFTLDLQKKVSRRNTRKTTMYGGTFDVDRSNGGPNDSSGTSKKIIRTWIAPPKGVTEWEGTSEEMKILFETLPKELSDHLIQMFPKDVLINLNEIYLQLGQIPECVVVNKKNGGRSERSKFPFQRRIDGIYCIPPFRNSFDKSFFAPITIINGANSLPSSES